MEIVDGGERPMIAVVVSCYYNETTARGLTQPGREAPAAASRRVASKDWTVLRVWFAAALHRDVREHRFAKDTTASWSGAVYKDPLLVDVRSHFEKR